MRRSSCDRWAAVSDAQAIGRPVSESDALFFEHHEATCTACAGEGDVWRRLGKVLAGPPSPSGIRLGRASRDPGQFARLAEDETAFDAILRAVPRRSESHELPPRRGSAGVFAMALAACAAGVAAVRVVPVVMAVASSTTAMPAASRAASTLDAPFELAGDNDRELAARAASHGDSLPNAGRAAEPSASAPTAPPAMTAVAPSASPSSLAAARESELKGDAQSAAAGYRAVYAAQPHTAEGGVALVALGNLLLANLGDAKGALDAFDMALARGGASVARAAAYGRVRTLRALGRERDARVSAHAFVVRYRTGSDVDAIRRSSSSLHAK